MLLPAAVRVRALSESVTGWRLGRGRSACRACVGLPCDAPHVLEQKVARRARACRAEYFRKILRLNEQYPLMVRSR